MIRSFGDRDTQKFFKGKRIPRFEGFRRQAERRLNMLDAALSLQDLMGFKGNRLEKLLGNRAGQHSIRINERWRLCFNWKSDGPYDVEIVDYH